MHAAHARYGQQTFGNGIVDEPGQIRFVESRGGCSQCQYCAPGSAGLGNARIAHFARQIGTYTGDGVAYIVHRFGSFLVQLKPNADVHIAITHVGDDVPYALQRSNRVFNLARHFGFHLRRRSTFEGRTDGDGG